MSASLYLSHMANETESEDLLNLLKQMAKQLKLEGYAAELEYPGILAVVRYGSVLRAGFANITFGWDIFDTEGIELAEDHSELPPESAIEDLLDFVRKGLVKHQFPRTTIPLIKLLAEDSGVDSLYGIYRRVYKDTACGPTTGFYVDGKWVYCDNLRAFGTLEEMEAAGKVVTGVSVSSIVEGSDADIPGGLLFDGATVKDFWELVDSVDKEASALWDEANKE